MKLSLQLLNYPSHFVGSTSKYRPSYEVRFNPTLYSQPSSFLLQANGSDASTISKKVLILGSAALQNNQTTSPLSEVNTIGIIGGISAVSTLNFLDKLVRWSSEGEETLPFVVCSDPGLHKKLLFHEKSLVSSLKSKEYWNKIDTTPIMENLIRKITFLEQAGARCIVMPCPISHAWHDEISKGCSLPILHVGECVAKELKEANLKPLEAGSSLRIGVLATNGSLQARFYQEKLHNEGFEVVLLDKETMEHTVIPAIKALHNKDMEGARNLLRIALQVLLVRAVNTVVLGSDDICGLLPQDDPLLKKCLDPMDALVRSTIKWAKCIEKEGRDA
ncbi:hypothetical protein AQUCO_00100805v1 [Aquilegia coerulea]|uniref:Aspartate racemase n=1 Tax=Aquilegia coerulea TaxID=218851 RepID=A0A2G5FC10_AQUCA|nr:hypothetical protein AQUCO_00100805v1 [Aquilegia coerulea]